MSTQENKVGILLGVLCDPLHKQLKKQGITVTASDMSNYQKAVDGFLRLKILGCMGDKEADRIAQRLVSKIVKGAERIVSQNSKIV